MIAVSSIRTNQAESIMSDNYSDKTYALHIAEMALSEVEQWLLTENFTFFDLMGNGCKQTKCFNYDCVNGLCLTAFIDHLGRCINTQKQPYSDGTLNTNNPLTTNTKPVIVWDDHRYHNKIKNELDINLIETKFIVEFFCFDRTIVDIKNKYSSSPVYRITVLAYGSNPNNKVMLQSLFTVGNT